MRKLGIWLLNLFRRKSLLIRRLRDQTEDDTAARRVVGGEAWNEFCDTLKTSVAPTLPGGSYESETIGNRSTLRELGTPSRPTSAP